MKVEQITPPPAPPPDPEYIITLSKDEAEALADLLGAHMPTGHYVSGIAGTLWRILRENGLNQRYDIAEWKIRVDGIHMNRKVF